MDRNSRRTNKTERGGGLRQAGSRAALLALIIALMVSMLGGMMLTGCSGKGSGGADTPDGTAEKETEQAVEEPLFTIFFASDYQAEEGWPEPAETLAGILAAGRADGHIPDEVVMCGDYTNDRKLHDYQLSPEGSISEIRKVVKAGCEGITDDQILFNQGNHDKLTGSIADPGLHEFDDCLIYVINTENDFPWKQGKVDGCHDKVERAAAEMKECFDGLIARGETRPVFIAGHVPLHFTARTSSRHTTGDNLYSRVLFDVVNEAGRSLDIIYLFGHDHSKGWDCYLGGSCVYRPAGSEILIPDYTFGKMTTDSYTEETLNFTYMNAGYTGYYMNCGPDELDNGTIDEYAAADDTLTGTFFEIYPDRIEISRYSADGEHVLSAEGEGDPYKDNIDKGLIGEEHYSRTIESPQTVDRISR